MFCNMIHMLCYMLYTTLIITESSWWLLMALCQFGTRTHAIIMITHGNYSQVRRCFKNVYELESLRALTILMSYQNHIFQYMGKIFVWNFKVTTQIWCKTSQPYIERSLRGRNSKAVRFKSSQIFLKLTPHSQDLNSKQTPHIPS